MRIFYQYGIGAKSLVLLFLFLGISSSWAGAKVKSKAVPKNNTVYLQLIETTPQKKTELNSDEHILDELKKISADLGNVKLSIGSRRAEKQVNLYKNSTNLIKKIFGTRHYILPKDLMKNFTEFNEKESVVAKRFESFPQRILEPRFLYNYRLSKNLNAKGSSENILKTENDLHKNLIAKLTVFFEERVKELNEIGEDFAEKRDYDEDLFVDDAEELFASDAKDIPIQETELDKNSIEDKKSSVVVEVCNSNEVGTGAELFTPNESQDIQEKSKPMNLFQRIYRFIKSYKGRKK